MYNLDALVNFLETIEDFYKAEKGEEKKGIGHEIEHINGVILRASEYANMINDNLFTYQQTTPVDMGIVTTCAALHDIGNVIERDAHGQYAYGIVMGELTMEDFFNVPYKNKKTGEYLTRNEVENLTETIEYYGYNFKSGNEKYYYPMLSFLTAQVFFNLAYNDTGITTPNGLRNFLKSEYTGISQDLENAIIKNLTDEKGNLLISYNPKLKEITKQIQEIFGSSSKELSIIANAVQDHNIDYKNDMERYESRSIYGMIVSDADKDTVPEVFAIRTIAYAANKLGVQKHAEYCIEKNPSKSQIKKWGTTFVPNLKRCATHVLHQAWERFRESNDEYQERTKKPISKRDFWKDIAEYKEKLSGTKGIAEIKSIFCPESQYDKERAIAGKNFIVDSKHNLITFMILPQEGEDLYSELDNFSRTSKIRDSRKSFIDKVREWSDPTREKESLISVFKLAQEWDKAKSNEEIIGKYEAEARKDMFASPVEYSFKSILEKVLAKGCIGGYSTNASLDSVISTAAIESAQEQKEEKIKKQKASKDVKNKNTKNNDDPNL